MKMKIGELTEMQVMSVIIRLHILSVQIKQV